MKKILLWMMAAIIACGGINLITSCSNDNEPSAKFVFSDKKNQPEASSVFMKNFKIETPAIDFDALTLLSISLHQGTAKVIANDSYQLNMDQFVKALSSLLDNLLQGNGQGKSDTRSWQLGDLGNTLQSAINVSKILESLYNNSLFGPDSISESYNFVVNDTLTYKVTVDKKRGYSIAATSFDNSIQRRVTIDKNGTWLMTIDANQGNMAKIKENHLDVNTTITGSLTYGDLQFTLDKQIQDTDSLTTTLSYLKDNAPIIDITMQTSNNLTWENLMNNNVLYKGKLTFNLLGGNSAIECDINDMGKFYDLGLETSKYLLSDKTKEKCQQLTDKVNSVISTHLYLLGNDFGILTIDPLLNDSVNNEYVPSLMIQGSPTDEKVALKDILNAFGITLESLMDMIFS